MNKLFVLVLVFIVIAFIWRFFLSKLGPIKTKYLYRKKDLLMTSAERELFGVLVGLVGNEYLIFSQIHLATILDHKVVGQNWRSAFRHIDEKSVDFVICDKKSTKLLLVIELDDKTHEFENRRIRDEEVERILSEAHIPLLRIENKGLFDKGLIATQLKNYLAIIS
jgi:very-short-patch-repair endonuclease